MSVKLSGPLADRSSWSTEECSIGKAMEAVGSRTAMVLLREAFYGTTRFDDFAALAGVTDAVAAARLKQLVEVGVLEKRPYREPGQRTRHEYLLTQMGRDLFPAVFALMQWGNKHLQAAGGPLALVDGESGEPVTVAARTPSGEEIAPEDIAVRVNLDWLRQAGGR
ncbi:MAG: winged helix-turn-helix transcriptional regulator [Leucobacter sp.]